jgi:putative hemolysin
MKKQALFLGAIFTFILAGCQKSAPIQPLNNGSPSAPQVNQAEFIKDFSYQCDGGKSFTVKMNEAGNKVLFIESEKDPLELDQTISASGIRYSDGKTVFWGKGETAFVEVDNVRIYDNCSTSSVAAEPPKAEPSTGIANPASVNCVKNRGKTVVRKNKLGEYGVCLFEDNRQCEEWALFRGECPMGGLKVTGYQTDGEVYCAITGGEVVNPGSAHPLCKKKDGAECDAQANLDGDCPAPNNPNPKAGNTEAP